MKKRIALGMFLVAATSIAKENFNLIRVNDVAPLVEKHSAETVILDANNQDTRKEEGVIPGAVLLSSSKKYNIQKELPADKSKKLVFYCANEQCMASHAAADRAVKAGYKDVNVLTDGIQGWKKSGQKVDHVKL